MAALLTPQTARSIARVAQTLAAFDPANAAQRVASDLDSSARSAASSAQRRVDDAIDAGLSSVGLQREPTAAERIVGALGWAALGATAVGSGVAATRLDADDVTAWLNDMADALADASTTARDAIDVAPDMARTALVSVGDAGLAAIGLQRRPTMMEQVARGAGLVAIGAAVGAGVAMAMQQRTTDASSRSTDEDVATAAHDDETEAATNADEAETKATDANAGEAATMH